MAQAIGFPAYEHFAILDAGLVANRKAHWFLIALYQRTDFLYVQSFSVRSSTESG